MSVEEINETTAARLAHLRVPRWFLYHHAATKDILQSAQNAADQTGEPQFVVDMPQGRCTKMVISDTRRALAVAPGRFARMMADDARQAAREEVREGSERMVDDAIQAARPSDEGGVPS